MRRDGGSWCEDLGAGTQGAGVEALQQPVSGAAWLGWRVRGSWLSRAWGLAHSRVRCAGDEGKFHSRPSSRAPVNPVEGKLSFPESQSPESVKFLCFVCLFSNRKHYLAFYLHFLMMKLALKIPDTLALRGLWYKWRTVGADRGPHFTSSLLSA